MKEFFDAMSLLEQTYWIISLIASVVLLLVFVLTFIGGDIDIDIDADTPEFDLDDDGIGFQFFTFKNIVAFFTIFGWSGVVCIDNGMSQTITLLLSTVAGVIMMILTAVLFYWMHKLAQTGTLKINNAIGVVGEVYLPIGAQRSKMGKVNLKVQGAYRELEALTDNSEELKTGSMIKVIGVISAEILLVEQLTN
jgi:hypothetical protein